MHIVAPKDSAATEPKKRSSLVVDNENAIKTIVRARTVGAPPDPKAAGADKKGPPQKAALKGMMYS